MSVTRLNSECITCLLGKYLNKVPKNTEENLKITYMQGVLDILARADKGMSAPEIMAEIVALQRELFNFKEDFSEIKKYFNSLMLSREPSLEKEIASSNEPLKSALLYAMLGNYIDFGAMDSVDESKLQQFLSDVSEMPLNKKEYSLLLEDLEKAESLVYITDNCGEVVLDKLFIKQIKRQYPKLSVEVIVRGEPVLNDATIEDAYQVGLDKIVNVVGNGTNIAGTCLTKLPKSIKAKIDDADVIIAKGQANFETLRYSKKNIYYIFMCKCEMFAHRFGVERLSGMLLNDLRMK